MVNLPTKLDEADVKKLETLTTVGDDLILAMNGVLTSTDRDTLLGVFNNLLVTIDGWAAAKISDPFEKAEMLEALKNLVVEKIKELLTKKEAELKAKIEAADKAIESCTTGLTKASITLSVHRGVSGFDTPQYQALIKKLDDLDETALKNMDVAFITREQALLKTSIQTVADQLAKLTLDKRSEDARREVLKSIHEVDGLFARLIKSAKGNLILAGSTSDIDFKLANDALGILGKFMGQFKDLENTMGIDERFANVDIDTTTNPPLFYNPKKKSDGSYERGDPFKDADSYMYFEWARINRGNGAKIDKSREEFLERESNARRNNDIITSDIIRLLESRLGVLPDKLTDDQILANGPKAIEDYLTSKFPNKDKLNVFMAILAFHFKIDSKLTPNKRDEEVKKKLLEEIGGETPEVLTTETQKKRELYVEASRQSWLKNFSLQQLKKQNRDTRRSDFLGTEKKRIASVMRERYSSPYLSPAQKTQLSKDIVLEVLRSRMATYKMMREEVREDSGFIDNTIDKVSTALIKSPEKRALISLGLSMVILYGNVSIIGGTVAYFLTKQVWRVVYDKIIGAFPSLKEPTTLTANQVHGVKRDSLKNKAINTTTGTYNPGDIHSVMANYFAYGESEGGDIELDANGRLTAKKFSEDEKNDRTLSDTITSLWEVDREGLANIADFEIKKTVISSTLETPQVINSILGRLYDPTSGVEANFYKELEKQRSGPTRTVGGRVTGVVMQGLGLFF